MASNVIMICLAGIMLVSGWKVFTILRNYQADKSVYNKISEEAGDDIDFDALRKINPDVIGWLYYEDTVIDYPVVQGENNDVYLSMLFDRTWGGCGTLFADCVTEAPFNQFNTIVYGHHMKDGTMFACLKELRDPEYCAKHPKLELTTPEGKFDLEIWAFLAVQIVINAARLKAQGKDIMALLDGLGSPAESKEVRLKIKAEDFRQYGAGVLEDFSKWAEYSGDLEIVEPNYEGVRVNYDMDGSRGWFLLRMSLHDPVMPLNVESETPGGTDKALAAVYDFMKDYKEIEIPEA